MEELREGFLLAGSRASAAEEVSTAVGVEVFTAAEAIDNSVSYLERNLRNGERNHEHESDRQNIFPTGTQLGGCAKRSGIAGDGNFSIQSRSEIWTGDLFVSVESEQRSLPSCPK